MAAKGKQSTKAAKAGSNGHRDGIKRRKAEFKGFAPDALSESSKEHVKNNLLTPEQVLDFIVNQAELGYKVSFSYSQEASFVAATCYGLWADMENGGVSLTARHSDLQVAVSTLRHLVYDVYDGGKWEQVDNYDW